MEPIYIVAIACGALFLLLVVAFSISYSLRSKKDLETAEELKRMYSDENLEKMEYDSGSFDAEVEKLMHFGSNPESQVTIDDLLNDGDDGSGMEEITGNYKP